MALDISSTLPRLGMAAPRDRGALPGPCRVLATAADGRAMVGALPRDGAAAAAATLLRSLDGDDTDPDAALWPI